MSERDEELELEALQRQLDDAFETTRPRRDFEDELWLRIQRRRPFGDRLRDMLGGLVGGFREAPAIPIATVALLLIVVVGVGVLGSDLSPFKATHRTESAALAPGTAAGGTNFDNNGRVPTPALHPGATPSNAYTGVPVPATQTAAASNLYYGPASLEWTGVFSTETVMAPVLTYAEPTAAQMHTALGDTGSVQGVSIQVQNSDARLPREPVFAIAETNKGAALGMDPVTAASTFLDDHNLTPPWPFTISVVQDGPVTRVVFQRGFPVQNADAAYLVNWNGDRYGIEVDITNGTRSAVGPLPLGLVAQSLPLISNSDAARLAVSEPPASAQAFSPTPTVKLDKVELVYALAISGHSGYYEPAYLFSGTFTYNGQSYVKRVLVPLVVASLRS